MKIKIFPNIDDSIFVFSLHAHLINFLRLEAVQYFQQKKLSKKYILAGVSGLLAMGSDCSSCPWPQQEPTKPLQLESPSHTWSQRRPTHQNVSSNLGRAMILVRKYTPFVRVDLRPEVAAATIGDKKKGGSEAWNEFKSVTLN